MTNRVQLMPIGRWMARDGRGPYSMPDIEAAQRVMVATIATQGKTRMMIDYDHQFVRAPAVAGAARAAGWVNAFYAEADGIWAEVEWTAAASAMIEAREYRYLSPYFIHAKDGTVTRIVNAGLVNVPAFNMAALASAVDGHAVLQHPTPIDALSADERDIIQRLGLSEAAYLDARKERQERRR